MNVARLGVLLVAVLTQPASAQPLRDSAGLDLELARQTFEEARRLSHSDAGRLWGEKLYGPMLFVDPHTRQVVANWRDRAGHLEADGRIWTGTLTPEIGVSNTVVDWGGVKWSMIMWPLPQNEAERRALLMHECFHRIQNDLGIPPLSPPNLHLDAAHGRTWIRMEMRALAAALAAEDDEERRLAIDDALHFRSWRRFDLENAETEERQLELNEGLAEYTGVRLSGADRAAQVARTERLLRMTDRHPSLMRSFAYATGSAYAILLDGVDDGWRSTVDRHTDLGGLLAHLLRIELPPPAGLEEPVAERVLAYGIDEIRDEEGERAWSREERLAGYRALLVDGPVLTIERNSDVRYTFSQQTMEALPGAGTVHGTVRVSGPWGVLRVTGGALFTDPPRGVPTIRVAAPYELDADEDGFVVGEGWTLQLAEGWRLGRYGRGWVIRRE